MDSSRMKRSALAALVALAAASVAPAVAPNEAVAQESVEEYAATEPTAEQVKLNEAAVEAMLAEEYDKAVRLLQASLDLGELNVTYLNLGRAYQKLGECDASRKALLSVVTAPAVEQPPPRIVDAKADEYLAELDAECDFGPTTAEAPAPADALSATAATAPPQTNYVGWSAVAAGGALLATSGVFYLFAQSEYGEVVDALDDGSLDQGLVVDMSRREAIEHQSRGDTFSTVALSTAIAGVALTGLGAYLVFDEDAPAEAAVSLGTDGDGLGVRLGGRF